MTCGFTTRAPHNSLIPPYAHCGRDVESQKTIIPPSPDFTNSHTSTHAHTRTSLRPLTLPPYLLPLRSISPAFTLAFWLPRLHASPLSHVPSGAHHPTPTSPLPHTLIPLRSQYHHPPQPCTHSCNHARSHAGAGAHLTPRLLYRTHPSVPSSFRNLVTFLALSPFRVAVRTPALPLIPSASTTEPLWFSHAFALACFAACALPTSHTSRVAGSFTDSPHHLPQSGPTPKRLATRTHFDPHPLPDLLRESATHSHHCRRTLPAASSLAGLRRSLTRAWLTGPRSSELRLSLASAAMR